MGKKKEVELMPKDEWLEIGVQVLEEWRQEALEEWKENNPDKKMIRKNLPKWLKTPVSKNDIERLAYAGKQLMLAIGEQLQEGEKAELMGFKIERVKVSGRHGVLEHANGELYEFNTQDKTKIKITPLKDLKNI